MNQQPVLESDESNCQGLPLSQGTQHSASHTQLHVLEVGAGPHTQSQSSLESISSYVQHGPLFHGSRPAQSEMVFGQMTAASGPRTPGLQSQGTQQGVSHTQLQSALEGISSYIPHGPLLHGSRPAQRGMVFGPMTAAVGPSTSVRGPAAAIFGSQTFRYLGTQPEWSQDARRTQSQWSQGAGPIQLRRSQQDTQHIQSSWSQQHQAQVAKAETLWRQHIRKWYPNLHDQTYFLPPLHFNRVSYREQEVAGQSVLVLQEASDQPHDPVNFISGGSFSQDSKPPLASRVWPDQAVPPGPIPHVYDMDVRDDQATQRVRLYIQDVAETEKEVMLVLSNLEFRKYLDNPDNPTSAAAIALLPRTGTLRSSEPGSHPRETGRKQGAVHKRQQTNLHAGLQGDFDILIIHSRYGLIVGEIKSVGADLSKTRELDKAVLRAIDRGIKQLNKAEGVLKRLMSDLTLPKIIKTLMLPNITSTQLIQALTSNSQAAQAVCQCIGGGTDISAAVARCLTEDSFTSSLWWQRAVKDGGLDISMTPDLYEILVARFCGPATTVDVPTITTPSRSVELRTLSEAVALTGFTMAMLTLYPKQLELVKNPLLPRVFLWGPPGTGKTVILCMKSLQWGRAGKNVHLLSSHKDSRAAILLIANQLLNTPGIEFMPMPEPGTPLRSLVTDFHKILPGPRVCTHFFDFENEGDVKAAVKKLASAARDGELFVIADEAFQGRNDTSGRFAKFCTDLYTRVPALHLWAAAVQHVVVPSWLRTNQLTLPVRSPPAVVKEVSASNWFDNLRVPRYSSSVAPSPTYGPKIRRLCHWETKNDARRSSPLPGHTFDLPQNCLQCGNAVADLMEELRVGQPGQDLQYRDIFILCSNARFDLPVVRSLRARGVPVQVLTSDVNETSLRIVALALRNKVTVTEWKVVSGLERRVVVVMWSMPDEFYEALYAKSRSSSFLACFQ